jgi:hypothetical protein
VLVEGGLGTVTAMPSPWVRLASGPDAPVLPEHMTLDQLRESILVDLELLRETGVLDFPRLPQGVVDKC